MAKNEVSAAIGSLKAVLSGDDDFVRDAVRGYMAEVLEEEMSTGVGRRQGPSGRWAGSGIGRATAIGRW